MTATPFDYTRMQIRLEKLLMLEQFRPVCPGVARATQVLAIGSDIVCRDEVLIEEIVYPLADTLNAEMNGMQIKMGMLSPFARTSTCPPKYYYSDRNTAWLVTSIPAVSLAAILEEFETKFPAHYTWDRPAYVRDVFRAIVDSCRFGWTLRRKPLDAVRQAAARLRETMPQRIVPVERMQFAAMLVDAVAPKHSVGIYHDNISPHTCFFSDALSPRVLCNYAGIRPAFMDEFIPARILTPGRDDTFREQSVDTYALARITFELITGRKLSGTGFMLDPAVEAVTPAWLVPRPESSTALNTLKDIIAEIWRALARVTLKVRTTFDESHYVNMRALTRASGSILRSLPGIRRVLDIWLPTDIARVLQAILDSHTNETLFGQRSRRNRGLRNGCNANLPFLRAALPRKPLSSQNRITRFVQNSIRRTQPLPQMTGEDTEAGISFSLLMERPNLIRFAAVLSTLVILCAGMSDMPETAIQAFQGAASAQQPPGCSARLLSNRRYPGVYKLTGLRKRCRTADIVFSAADELGNRLPPSLGETRVRLYLSKAGPDGYGAIVAVRPCPSEALGCESGEFYRVTGISGIGERVRFDENDLVGFRPEPILRFIEEVNAR